MYMNTVRQIALTLRITHKALMDMVALPPRKPKGDVRNMRRSQVVCIANHQARVTLMTKDGQAKHRKQCTICKVRVFKRGVRLQ